MNRKEFALNLAERAGAIMQSYFASGMTPEWKGAECNR